MVRKRLRATRGWLGRSSRCREGAGDKRTERERGSAQPTGRTEPKRRCQKTTKEKDMVRQDSHPSRESRALGHPKCSPCLNWSRAVLRLVPLLMALACSGQPPDGAAVDGNGGNAGSGDGAGDASCAGNPSSGSGAGNVGSGGNLSGGDSAGSAGSPSSGSMGGDAGGGGRPGSGGSAGSGDAGVAGAQCDDAAELPKWPHALLGQWWYFDDGWTRTFAADGSSTRVDAERGTFTCTWSVSGVGRPSFTNGWILYEQCPDGAPGPSEAEEVAVIGETGFSTREGEYYRSYVRRSAAPSVPAPAMPSGDNEDCARERDVLNGLRAELVGKWYNEAWEEGFELRADGTASTDSIIDGNDCEWVVSGEGAPRTRAPWILQFACPNDGDSLQVVSVDDRAIVIRGEPDWYDLLLTYERVQ